MNLSSIEPTKDHTQGGAGHVLEPIGYDRSTSEKSSPERGEDWIFQPQRFSSEDGSEDHACGDPRCDLAVSIPEERPQRGAFRESTFLLQSYNMETSSGN